LGHPSDEELADLCRESLPAKREREVVRHLLAGCPQCLAAAPPSLSVLLGLSPVRRMPTPAEEDAYDAIIERASARPLALERHLREQRVQADKGLKLLAAGRKLPRAMEPLARMWALLDRSWQLRFEDPQKMVDLAWSAEQVSCHLDEAFYGREWVRDFQARSTADLGNAYRVANRPRDAERALLNARQLFEQGTGDAVLEMRLLDIESSWLAQIRRFDLATQKLLQMLAFYEKKGDQHLVGRTLVKLGLFAGYEGNYELAVRRSEQSLKLIDAKHDPALACCAAANLILFLVESGRLAEAKKLRLVHSRHLRRFGGRITQLKIQDLEGRIAAGEGQHLRAEAIFREAIDGFQQADLPLIAGTVMINLTAALLAQGKAREAERVASKTAKLFSALGIQREALQAVVLLRDSFRMQAATLEKVLEVADFLRRSVSGPSLYFEAQAWEEE
jgi:hypothetical protein